MVGVDSGGGGRVEGSLDEFPGLISRERRKRKTLAWTRFGGRERDRYGGKERISVSRGGGREGGGPFRAALDSSNC